ncbi:MAG TPA: SRPBCC family protein [Acidimicrobiales bacterium]
MTATTIDVDAPPAAVHATLIDAESYPRWLVGARHIRGVDADWPTPGSSFHHTLGWGPVTIRDRTRVVRNEPPHELVLHAFMGPLGSARVHITVAANPDGGSHVAFEEEPSGGLVRALWNPLTRPLVGISLWGRNAISLQSLRDLAEERSATA